MQSSHARGSGSLRMALDSLEGQLVTLTTSSLGYHCVHSFQNSLVSELGRRQHPGCNLRTRSLDLFGGMVSVCVLPFFWLFLPGENGPQWRGVVVDPAQELFSPYGRELNAEGWVSQGGRCAGKMEGPVGYLGSQVGGRRALRFLACGWNAGMGSVGI